jgi:serine/threonine protein kinase
VSWDGRDGAWRVRNEERVLSRLLDRGVRVPKVYSSFEMDDNYYLVMEFVDGESLHDLLLRQSRRLPITRIITWGIQLSAFIAQMHRAGWAWRDCKPKNLIVTRQGSLMPIDFEGASEIKNPDCSRWGTPGFIPSKTRKALRQAVVNDDLFGLGATLYLLITGRIFDHNQPTSAGKLRKDVPLELLQLVEALLNDTARLRPTIQSAHARLNSILRKQPKSSRKLTDAQAA